MTKAARRAANVTVVGSRGGEPAPNVDAVATAEEATRLWGGSPKAWEKYFNVSAVNLVKAVVTPYPYMRPLQPLVQAMDPGPAPVEPTAYEAALEMLQENGLTLRTV